MNPPFLLRRTTFIWLPILALTLAGVAACGQPASSASETGEMQIRGMVLEVVARNITEVETLRLLGEDDREYRFTSEGFVGFSPSHLREHQLFGQPVIVSYVQKGEQLVAVAITD
jgi:hypothetical protein